MAQINITQLIERGKAEILEDMQAGIVPADTRNFATLHDYVDANEYAGLCEPEIFNAVFDTEIPNHVQDALDEWLQSRSVN